MFLGGAGRQPIPDTPAHEPCRREGDRPESPQDIRITGDFPPPLSLVARRTETPLRYRHCERAGGRAIAFHTHAAKGDRPSQSLTVANYVSEKI